MLTVTHVEHTCKGVSITKANLFVNAIEFTCAFWGSRERVFVFPFLFAFAELVSSPAFLDIILPAFISVCLGYLNNGQEYFKAFVVAAFFENICFVFWEKKPPKTKQNNKPTNS